MLLSDCWYAAGDPINAVYSALESIIIPIPVTRFSRRGIGEIRRMATHSICLHRRIGCWWGWRLGARAFLGPHIHELISSLPVALAAPSAFAW